MGSDVLTTSFFIMDDEDDDSTSSEEPLTPLRIQFLDESIYGVLMASSDVDQKFLGKFAQQFENADPLLSTMLYRLLGLSVLLSKKLFRARRLRRLDVTRDTKSLQLYHHIIWLSREGLVILEEYILPSVQRYAELKVLSHKLRGSFYHIFVLFHNQPSINRAAAIPSAQQARAASKGENPGRNTSIRKTPPNVIEVNEFFEQVAGSMQQGLPPGLAPISIPKPAASFLLPATDYIPNASACFEQAMKLATGLSGSHPLRLSVAVEYCAYRYDCLHDGEGSRRLARATIKSVYNATEGMDDETFADSANLVGVLGKMMKRGLGTSSTGGTASSVGRTERSTTPDYRPRAGTAHQSQMPSTPQSHSQRQRQQQQQQQQQQQSPQQQQQTSTDSPRSQRQIQTEASPGSAGASPSSRKVGTPPVSKYSRASKLTTPWEAPPSPEVMRKAKPSPLNTTKDLPPTPAPLRWQRDNKSSSSANDQSPARSQGRQ